MKPTLLKTADLPDEVREMLAQLGNVKVRRIYLLEIADLPRRRRRRVA